MGEGASVRSQCEVSAKSVRSQCEVSVKSVRSRCEVGAKSVRSRCEVGAKSVRSRCEELPGLVVSMRKWRGWSARQGLTTHHREPILRRAGMASDRYAVVYKRDHHYKNSGLWTFIEHSSGSSFIGPVQGTRLPPLPAQRGHQVPDLTWL
jgi:hypothetical protein